MDRQYGGYRYTSHFVEDTTDGYGGYELIKIGFGEKVPIARVIFWDAIGQFCVETLGGDLPVVILEELIDEAKSNIKTR